MSLFRVLVVLAITACVFSFVTAFQLQRQQVLHQRRWPTRAFAKVPLVAGGKRVEVDEGSSLMNACGKLGLKVPTSCKKGECGTCTVTVAGKKIKACVGKVPDAPKLKSLLEKGLAVSVDN